MVADQLKKLRKGIGVSQAQFAHIFGVGVGTVGMWESGQRAPKRETIERLADFYHVTTDYIYGRSENEAEAAPQEGDLSLEEYQLLEGYRRLTPARRKAILELVRPDTFESGVPSRGADPTSSGEQRE
jgi:transcriptional regulator with XRE-family HTH domain